MGPERRAKTVAGLRAVSRMGFTVGALSFAIQPALTEGQSRRHHRTTSTGRRSTDAGVQTLDPSGSPEVPVVPTDRMFTPGETVRLPEQTFTGHSAAARFEAWIRNWQTADIQLLRTYPEQGYPMALFQTSSGARILGRLSPWDATSVRIQLWITPRPRLDFAAPGPCVVPPEREYRAMVSSSSIDQMGISRSGSMEYRYATARWADVDGDGEPDVWVPVRSEGACPEDQRSEIYVMRGTCGHRVGIVGPGRYPWLDHEVVTLPPDASGLSPLELVAESVTYGNDGDPVSHLYRRRFEYRPSGYALTAERYSHDRCSHCASYRCNWLASP
jgi:hypothetical protein